MARTTLDFEYNGKEYSLAYNIDVVKRLDRSGLLAQIANGERPLTMTEDLFVSAFEANHSAVPNRARLGDIWGVYRCQRGRIAFRMLT